MRFRRLFVLGVLLGLLAGVSVAQGVLTGRYNMTRLDLAAGLPHNHVNHIFADSQGFVWISTYGGGAVRYDGYSFERLVASGLLAAVYGWPLMKVLWCLICGRWPRLV